MFELRSRKPASAGLSFLVVGGHPIPRQHAFMQALNLVRNHRPQQFTLCRRHLLFKFAEKRGRIAAPRLGHGLMHDLFNQRAMG